MKVIINESQFHLLEMFANTSQCEQVIDRVLRPLEKLKKCKFTPDGKYVVYEGKAYNTSNGEEVPINESWTLSDILHTGADVLSMGLDFVIPGSGAIVDTLNALSYIIEAQFKSNEEKDSLYLMAAITFAFVILPGPLQAMATPLKRAIKTGVGMTSPVVVKALKIIGGSLDTLLLGIPTRVNAALKSPLAKNILGSYRGKISGFITAFTTRTKSILGKLTGKAGKEGAEKAGKEGAEKVVKQMSGEQFQKAFTIPKNCASVNFCDTKNILKNLMNIIPSNTVFNPSKVKVLNRSTVAGREVIEVQLENGSKTLFYKSSGANQATTGKSAGEWFAIPGFAESGWFVKTSDSINLVKGGNGYLTSMSEFLSKNGAEGLGKKTVGKVVGKVGGASVDNAIKLLPVSAGAVSKELLPAIVGKSSALSKISDVPLGNSGGLVISKLGFRPGKTYGFGKKTFKIKDTAGEYIDFVDVVDGGKEVVKKMKVWDFLKTYIINPSTKLNTLAVPVITKATVRLFNNGTLNTEELNKMENIDSTQTQKDLTQLSALVAEYEGDSGKYTVNNKAKIVQQSLMKLGYPLPRFKDDGKFGPETLGALKKFQQDNGLTSSIGKMDRLTSKKLSELLKSKNIIGSEELQNSLNSM
jgi:hypothetical protein